MKYLKLWKYALCPFYVSFAPYIIMSLILGSLIGCNRVPKVGECFYSSQFGSYDERNIYQAKEIGDMSLKAINTKGEEYVFYSNQIDTEHFVDCFDIFECYKTTGGQHEACKLPRKSEPKASPSPSKNETHR